MREVVAAEMRSRDPLLATKLTTGVRSERFVARPRLLDLLDGGPEVRLVLVSAPAGFGKSTLLAGWLARADVATAWLSIDRGDNDLVRFSRYLVAAVRLATEPSVEAPLEGASGDFDEELVRAWVLEGLDQAARTRAMGSILVLDDYHLIDEPAIHRFVSAIVERLPPRTRVAIATRADPPLPLARLRARGELLEVRADELRFSTAEAADLLTSAGVELGVADIDTLTKRTEGWAAALRLAGVSLRARPDRASLIERFGASHRFILDYIVEEVLAGLEPEIQAFLLRTSILERLCGELCDAVTDEAGGQDRIEELERANLLILPLDDERRWYRYHALFAEILRSRLAALWPDEVAGLHARASHWHEEHGHDDEAISHAMLSGNLERTSWIVSMASGRHLNAGELGTVRRWLDALPDDLVRGHAQLSASYAWCQLLEGETEGVGARLDEADRAFEVGRDSGPVLRVGLPAQLALLRSILEGAQGDAEAAVREARQALELIPDAIPPVGRANLRGTANVLLGLSLRRIGDLASAEAAYEAGIPDLRAGGNVLALGRAIADLAGLAIDRADPARAVRLCEVEVGRADDLTSAAGNGAVWAALAAAREALGQLPEAEAAANRALELGTRFEDGPPVRSAQRTLARIASARARVSGRGPGQQRVIAGPSGLVESLTAREIEVLRLVALGRSNSSIAHELFVTVGTVKSHLHAASGKLGASNRVEAVVRARELGILD